MAQLQVEENVEVLRHEPTIRIETDGTSMGTHLFAADDTEIKYITRVELSIDVKQKSNEAVLHVLDVNGSIEATLKALKITKVPPAVCELLVDVMPPERHWFRQRSFFQIVRRSNKGTDHALVELVAQGWTAPTQPLKFTIPEYDR